ncbi:hypothetical protein EDB80DRAFT_377162 [Ilyonectria destructans]|nr:hypothetical protein EDB80DRAFT_377162 [Ilyonectria destructans]
MPAVLPCLADRAMKFCVVVLDRFPLATVPLLGLLRSVVACVSAPAGISRLNSYTQPPCRAAEPRLFPQSHLPP